MMNKTGVYKYYIRDKHTELKKNLSETILSTGEHYPYVLYNPETKNTELITSHQRFLWEYLSEPKTLKQLTVTFFDEYQVFASEEIQALMDKWIANKYIFSSTQIGNRSDQKRNYFNFEVTNFNSFVDFTYKYFAKLFFVPIIFLFLLGLSAIGAGFMAAEIILKFPDSLTSTNLNILLLLLIAWISIFLHELGHAYLARHYGATVTSAGIRLVFGIPVFFVDTTEMWIRPKIERINVTVAGIMMNWLIFGISSVGILLYGYSEVLASIRIINLMTVVLNLFPFFGFDGYYILIDFINLPNLRKYAADLLAGRMETIVPRLSVDQRRFVVGYTFISIFAAIALTVFAIYMWLSTFGRLI